MIYTKHTPSNLFPFVKSSDGCALFVLWEQWVTPDFKDKALKDNRFSE